MEVEELRKCKQCGEEKSIKLFPINGGYYVHRCKKCRSSDRRIQYANSKEQKLSRFKHRIKSKYNLSLEEFCELGIKQNFKCAICNKDLDFKLNKKSRLFAVDHCHNTKKIRGILCNLCNVGLGHFQDSPELLRKAADYLESY